jgi:hypothetical protein
VKTLGVELYDETTRRSLPRHSTGEEREPLRPKLGTCTWRAGAKVDEGLFFQAFFSFAAVGRRCRFCINIKSWFRTANVIFRVAPPHASARLILKAYDVKLAATALLRGVFVYWWSLDDRSEPHHSDRSGEVTRALPAAAAAATSTLPFGCNHAGEAPSNRQTVIRSSTRVWVPGSRGCCYRK